jgi:hypothetical protein
MSLSVRASEPDGEPGGRLDIHQQRGLISAHQEEVRHVTAHPPASVRPQQERLGRDRRHRRVEIATSSRVSSSLLS